MTPPNRYQASWENFWRSTTGAEGEIFWDADPAHAAQHDYATFRGYMDPDLPLIDLGCGNGTQTRFLAGYFPRVVGTEISPAAVEIARTKNSVPNVGYRILDILNEDEAQTLHEELGDANLYMRAVLHQLSPADHAAAVRCIGHLLGTRGVLYFLELSSEAEPYFARLIKEHGAPSGLTRVFQHQITPGMLNEKDLTLLFPTDRYTLLSTARTHIQTVHILPSGEVVKVPAFHAIFRQRQPQA